jgi:hypothetical protein
MLMLTGFVTATACASEGFLMWQAQRDGKTIHLLANIAFVSPDLLQFLAPEVQDAFAKSDIIMFESAMDPEQKILERKKIMEAAAYPEDDNLLNHLPSKTAAVFDGICAKLAIENNGIIRQKPWSAAQNLRRIASAQAGVQFKGSLENNFWWRVSHDGKPADYLSGADQLIAMYGGLSDELQIKMFEKTLKETGDLAGILKQTETIWRHSDAEAATQLVNNSYRGYEDLRAGIFHKQHEQWADQLDAQLSQTKIIFALIDLEHLAGADNLLDQLHKRGFLIAQVIPE